MTTTTKQSSVVITAGNRLTTAAAMKPPIYVKGGSSEPFDFSQTDNCSFPFSLKWIEIPSI
ncbi:hypothetical protein TSUD_215750 [Trifolium subterraneum]|uniref:Uncharacterized protein n=1 Tax=Trifolium subterraneum TaxID=3900 RepID=A0A2Z6M5V2_TRISU|nr:hypothetical protein TSUD_215750 [Trifolium subterraneum]